MFLRFVSMEFCEDSECRLGIFQVAYQLLECLKSEISDIKSEISDLKQDDAVGSWREQKRAQTRQLGKLDYAH